MRSLRAVAPLLLLTVASLAGCAHQDELLQPRSVSAYRFQGYTFPVPHAYDDNGTILADETHHALLAEGARPVVLEQMVPGGGAEPNIGITSKGSVFVTTNNEVRRSTDAGKTWDVVFSLHSPGSPTTENMWSSADPNLWVDPVTDRIFVAHLKIIAIDATDCVYIAYSDDDGAHWTDERLVPAAPGHNGCVTNMNDHPKIMTAPPGPKALLKPVGYPNMVYLCHNVVWSHYVIISGGTWCNASYDGGDTWQTTTNAIPDGPGFTVECAGINGHPAANKDGILFVPAGTIDGLGCNRPPLVAVSEDSGLTWTIRKFPGKAVQRSIDADLTFTPDGTGYMVYTSDDSLTYLLRSKDQFRTWDGPFRLSPQGHTINVFGAMASGDDGRIAVAYLGTVTPQPESDQEPDPSDAVGGTRWHLFVSVSQDAGAPHPTFVTQQVTPEQDPVQVGCVWLRGGGGGPASCRNLLDFIDLHHDKEGRFFTVITDGCTPRSGCTTDPDSATFQSHDQQIAVAVQDSGASLFAAKGLLPTLGITLVPQPDPGAHRKEGP